MKKLLITKCDECPHFDTRMTLGDRILEYCGYEEGILKEIHDLEIIPKFCPLENYHQGTKGSITTELETYIENLDETKDAKELLKMKNILWLLENGGN